MDEPVEVFVLQIEHPTMKGVSWTSVHRTEKGARSRLVDKVSEWNMVEAYQRDELVYGIGFLALED
ncbi:Uncharacterised protein [Mycobacteroides abscessus subsp. massiliense]|uniref:hypothetical protein n=1 Tax=Mycobacteroides abscessus TaxID=36809 RepID=UPI0009A6CEBC|nr:hypothetical protein [Mycobacteroides abscessus]SLC04939.1 Uncharacterised protein [Mycobacteroides abscessus subsp. massiliense]